MYHGPLRITTPVVGINDDLILTKYFHNIKLNHQHLFIDKNFQHPSIEDGVIRNVNDPTMFNASFLKKSFVYIITETVSEYPYPYFSEKTWKAMLTGVPFMIVNSRYSLQKLQHFGFKTFDNWWSEQYDTLATSAQRIQAIIVELEKLSKLSSQSLSQIRSEMQPTIEHNFNQLKTFKNNDIDNIRKKI